MNAIKESKKERSKKWLEQEREERNNGVLKKES